MPGAFLNEGTEGSEAGPGSDHDNWCRGAMRQAHRGFSAIYGYLAALKLVQQVVRTDAVNATSADLVLRDDSTDGDPGTVLFWRGGDAVVADLETRKQLEQVVDRGFAGWMFL